ncbi:MAG: hypothetical protein J6333_11400 [Planctomycetes bacterium]|nr:hypothetical protein [Planctomycetota bacterium]
MSHYLQITLKISAIILSLATVFLCADDTPPIAKLRGHVFLVELANIDPQEKFDCQAILVPVNNLEAKDEDASLDVFREVSNQNARYKDVHDKMIAFHFSEEAFRDFENQDSDLFKTDFHLYILPKCTEPSSTLTLSAPMALVTYAEFRACCHPQTDGQRPPTGQRTYKVAATRHPFEKMQKMRLLDTDGNPWPFKDTWRLHLRPSSAVWDKAVKDEIMPALTYSPKGPHDPSALTFPVYQGCEYSFINTVVTQYASPWVASEHFRSLQVWRPRVETGVILDIRLVNPNNPQPPAQTTSDRSNSGFSRDLCLAITRTLDAPIDHQKVVPLVYGYDRWDHKDRFKGWQQLCFRVGDNKAIKQHDKWVPAAIKVKNPVLKLVPGKKMYHVELLATPIPPEDVVEAETTLAVTDKASGKAIEDVAVYTLAPPHQRLNAKEPLPLKAGKHKLLFYAEGYRLREQEVTVHAKGKHVETVILDPLPTPVTLAFNGPADSPAEKLQLKFRYDNYPFLGTLKLTRVNWKDGASAVPGALERNIYPKLTLDNGRGEMPVAIDGRQPFTLCANAMPKPQPGMRSGSQELPLLVFRHAKGAPECQRAELKMPPCVKWKGKIDLKAANADGVIVIWTRKLDGIPDAPVAGATKTDDGECHAFLEPGQTYGRYMTLIGKDHKGQDACRSLPPYTVPADAKELPEETLTPGPAGSGVPVRDQIGGWMF